MSTSCAAAICPTSGTTRSSSSATATGGRPPTADSPPTSSTAAPAATQLGGAGGQVGMVARVRERVGRRVDDAHQQRRPAELQLATARAQPHVMWSLTFLIRRLPATSYTVTLSVNVPLRYACCPLKRLRCLTTRFESP